MWSGNERGDGESEFTVTWACSVVGDIGFWVLGWGGGEREVSPTAALASALGSFIVHSSRGSGQLPHGETLLYKV